MPFMKHLRILIIAFLSFYSLALQAQSSQSADQRISEILGSGDWFGLEREDARMKDSVSSDALRLMSGTMLSAYFNRPEELRAHLKNLIDNHSEEIGLQNVCDIRNMSVGGAEVNNILAYVLGDNQLDTLVRTDAILGMDFIKLAGSLSIDFKRNTIVFGNPERGAGTLPNLYIEPNNTLCLSADVNAEPQVLKFDTGSTRTNLSYSWYCAHKEVADGLEEVNVLLGTYGDTRTVSHLSMPDATFNVGGENATVSDILVHTSPDGNPCSGTVGLGLLRQFRKAAINLKDMTLTVR